MASVTITIANADVPDVLAAMEATWRKDAVALFFAGDDTAYDALTPAQKGRTLILADLTVRTINWRREQAQKAIPPATAPVVT